jgi:penicillin-binding protein 1A
MAVKTKKKKDFRKYVLVLWGIMLLPLIVLAIFIWLAATGKIGEQLPTFEELENPKTNLASEVISSDQEVLGKYYIENRTNVHYYDLSPNLISALKATEDIRFEEHSGVDLRGLFRVLFKTVFARQESSGGGSTITQQLAKNLFHEQPHTKMERVIQKLQEWVIAVRLEKNYTKEEIMAMYLNTVEFGSNAFGIKSASRTFFNKGPEELNVQEAAVIVGLLKAPTYYRSS